MLARAKQQDDAVAAQRGTAYAGEADPYKKPREIVDEDEDDDDLDDASAVDLGDDLAGEDDRP